MTTTTSTSSLSTLQQPLQLYVGGSNPSGQLGLGTTEKKITNYTRCLSFPSTKQYLIEYMVPSKGAFITLLARDKQTNKQVIFACGENTYTQLPLRDQKPETNGAAPLMPHQYGRIGAREGITEFSILDTEAFSSHSICHLGCGLHSIVVILSNLQVWYSGYILEKLTKNCFSLISNGQLSAKSIDQIKKLSVGYYHFCVLQKDGRVFGFGQASRGVLTFDSHVTQLTELTGLAEIPVHDVFCGTCSTFVITKDKKVMSCGDNNFGLLGLKNRRHKSYVFQPEEVILPLVPGEEVVTISPSWSQTYFLTNHSNIYFCGRSDSDDVGLGFVGNVFEPLKIPAPSGSSLSNKVIDIFAACSSCLFAKLQDGNYWVIGKNIKGELGMNGEPIKQFMHLSFSGKILSPHKIESIVLGYTSTYILIDLQQPMFAKRDIQAYHDVKIVFDK